MATTVPVLESTKPIQQVNELERKYTDDAEGLKVAPAATGYKNLSPELAAAVEASFVPKWTKEAWTIYFGIFTALCCSWANGYDGSLMTSVIAMKPFQERFNHPGTDGALIGAVFCLFQVGSFLGGPLAAWTSDRYGRRVGMFIGSILIIVSAVVSATSHHIAQICVGRVILGLGSVFHGVAAPPYSMEIALPHLRGRCTAFYNWGWYLGAIPAAGVTFGTNFIKSDISWQLPIILQCAACVIVAGAVWFIPESPRYHLNRGDIEAAHAFLRKYHGNGEDSPLVLLELEEMRQTLVLQEQSLNAAWWDYRMLFATRGSRWRMIQVIWMGICGQFSGNGLGYFITTIFRNLGITSVPAQLGYNLLKMSLNTLGSFCGAMLTDHMPRRRILTFGTLTLSCILAIFVGLNSVILKHTQAHEPVPGPLSKGALAVYMCFGFSFAFTYTPLQATVPVESLSTPMRAKGMAFYNYVMMSCGFINTFAGPIGLHNIGNKYVMVFVIWDALEALGWWFFGVESRGRTLEELDWIYEQPNPVKASQRLRE